MQWCCAAWQKYNMMRKEQAGPDAKKWCLLRPFSITFMAATSYVFIAHCMLTCLCVFLLRHNHHHGVISYMTVNDITMTCLSFSTTLTVRHGSGDGTASYLCACHQHLCQSLFPLLLLFASPGVQAQKSCPGSLAGTCSGLDPLYRSQWTGMQTGLFPGGEKREERTKM